MEIYSATPGTAARLSFNVKRLTLLVQESKTMHHNQHIFTRASLLNLAAASKVTDTAVQRSPTEAVVQESALRFRSIIPLPDHEGRSQNTRKNGGPSREE